LGSLDAPVEVDHFDLVLEEGRDQRGLCLETRFPIQYRQERKT
jgi:hypothetical protein